MEREERKREIVAYDTENSIILGDYLDILLNKGIAALAREDKGLYGRLIWHESGKQNYDLKHSASKLRQYEYIMYSSCTQDEKPEGPPTFIYSGGIRLPRYNDSGEHDEGSGNIVIAGKPGSGKSTLAFQFAAACASRLNNGIAVYYSLDVDDRQLARSLRQPEGELNINCLCAFSSKGETYDTSEELEEAFRRGLQKDALDRIVPQVVMPRLIPRGISVERDQKEDGIFLKRIEEIQTLLRAIKAYNKNERQKKEEKERNPMVKLVVIDSLDVFGETVLHREEINRLFMLFKQYGIIGVFTLGVADADSVSAETVDSSAVMYQADVVIALNKENYNNYSCSYFEIIKSRYTQHVLGHHPYKIDNCNVFSGNSAENVFYQQNHNLLKKVVVLPSLHYRINGSENSVQPKGLAGNPEHTDMEGETDRAKEKSACEKSLFGIKQMLEIMPNHFQDRCMAYPQIITISGNSGLFKSDIAINALLAGILFREENGLIVRLGDRDAFSVRGVRFEKKLFKKMRKRFAGPEEADNELRFYAINPEALNNHEPHKYTLKGWAVDKERKSPQLMEVTFKNGALLPEEFVEEICKIINQHKIRLVAFIDLKYIGSSYPFLVNSDTSGNLFLSAFVHIMRNYGVHVIMSSSLSGLEASDLELRKAGILADAIVTCTSGKKDQSVHIFGEGLITSKKDARIVTDEKKKYVLRFCREGKALGGTGVAYENVVTLSPFSIKLDPYRETDKKRQKRGEEKNSRKNPEPEYEEEQPASAAEKNSPA